ncbi:hypothetical protein SteCoe_34231 [Stentor coeruleus]|uniref:Uncharacterized protein n=1 Tax=Stentor coeruleus TaxID=5963 RepID=A0A1R2AV80_9CILI|nr:hypothetical protein SteCoe_34231 [Stentor coeruleus]
MGDQVQNNSKKISSALRKDIWMLILDFLCEKSLFTEIPRVNKFFRSISSNYSKFKTCLWIPSLARTKRKMIGYWKSIYKSILCVQPIVLNLLKQYDKVCYIKIEIIRHLEEDIVTDLKKITLPSLKSLNFINHMFLHNNLKFSLLSSLENLRIEYTNSELGSLQSFISLAPQLQSLKVKSQSFFLESINDFDFIQNYICLSFPSNQSSRTNVDTFLDKIIEKKVIEKLSLSSVYLYSKVQIENLLKIVPSLKVLKFKEETKEEKIDFDAFDEMIMNARFSNLTVLHVKNFPMCFNEDTEKSKEQEKFVGNVKRLLLECKTLRSLTLENVSCLSPLNLKQISKTITHFSQYGHLETFNYLPLKLLHKGSIKVLFIHKNIARLDSHSLYLNFLILKSMYQNLTSLEKIIVSTPKDPLQSIKSYQIKDLTTKSLKINHKSLKEFYLLVFWAKNLSIEYLKCKCTGEIENCMAKYFLKSSKNLKELDMTLWGNRKTNGFNRFWEKNLDKMNTLVEFTCNFSNEKISDAVFCSILSLKNLKVLILDNFAQCLKEPNTKMSLKDLESLEIDNFIASKGSFITLISAIEQNSKISVINIRVNILKSENSNWEGLEKLVKVLAGKSNLQNVSIKIIIGIKAEYVKYETFLQTVIEILNNNKRLKKFEISVPLHLENLLNYFKTLLEFYYVNKYPKKIYGVNIETICSEDNFPGKLRITEDELSSSKALPKILKPINLSKTLCPMLMKAALQSEYIKLNPEILQQNPWSHFSDILLSENTLNFTQLLSSYNTIHKKIFYLNILPLATTATKLLFIDSYINNFDISVLKYSLATMDNIIEVNITKCEIEYFWFVFTLKNLYKLVLESVDLCDNKIERFYDEMKLSRIRVLEVRKSRADCEKLREIVKSMELEKFEIEFEEGDSSVQV